MLINNIMELKYNYIIYHRNCPDGFAGLIIAHRSGNIHDEALIKADVPYTEKVPEQIKDKDILIIDVAYKLEILEEIIKLCNSLVFIDHHVTIKDDVENLKNKYSNKKLKIIYNQQKSGCALTWKYFYPNNKPPRFIRLIEDQDTGTWKLPDTKYFMYALDVVYNKSIESLKNFNKWERLFNKNEVIKLIKKGKQYNEYILHLVSNNNAYSIEYFPSQKFYDENIEFFDKPGQYKVAVFCGSCPSATILGNYIVKNIKIDFVIMWTFSLETKKYLITFRSDKVNVGKIAKLFGGGGHELASSGSFYQAQYNIQDLFFPESIPRR